MPADAIASSIEAGVLVANHLATARPLPKKVRTITGGGTQSPPIIVPTTRSENPPTYTATSHNHIFVVPPGGNKLVGLDEVLLRTKEEFLPRNTHSGRQEEAKGIKKGSKGKGPIYSWRLSFNIVATDLPTRNS
ncbi:hypothetical protein AVEN_134842-1 [Araneus ventricosus]|uniref:Uncharacterized protein n=1 Tax=Araneus ventricosus TaxID=182803 RepID=A0A4Y2ST05_ARAVE|nr:hypothetical protein AVEN_134842-1 [Araneus ventricosus]